MSTTLVTAAQLVLLKLFVFYGGSECTAIERGERREVRKTFGAPGVAIECLQCEVGAVPETSVGGRHRGTGRNQVLLAQ